MTIKSWIFFISAIVFTSIKFEVSSGASLLPSKFYQHGRGVIHEMWLSRNKYDLDSFTDIPNFPFCPTNVKNLDSFAHSELAGNYQHSLLSSYFVTPQGGKHTFFAICNNQCKLDIEMSPFGWKTILRIMYKTNNDWSGRVLATEVTLEKGFRYLLRLYHYGNANNPEFAKLGVKFPDNSEVRPISNAYLWRSMEFYDWKGLIGQRYDGITLPSSREMSDFYARNAAVFPANPGSYTCQPTLFEPGQDLGDYYAISFIGYMKLPESGGYSFKMHSNEISEVFITKDNVVESLGTTDQRKSSVIKDGGQFNNSEFYLVNATRVETWGYDWIEVEYKSSVGSFKKDWSGLLRNLLPAETAFSLPPPKPTMINSSVISTTLYTNPLLPPRDNWTYSNKFDLLAFETLNGESAPIQKFGFIGRLPHSFNFTGLKNYTNYSFYANYYGKIDGTIEYNILTSAVSIRTGENVPEVPPPRMFSMVLSSKSIRLSWNAYADVNLVNGICIGYEIRYAMKEATPKNWTALLINGESNREFKPTDLEEYTKYQMIVAGRTSKGTGVFSSPIELTTKEDRPTAPPSNVSVQNTSSSSILITWNDVPYWDQNGIIISYKILISKVGGGSGRITKTATVKSLSQSGLEKWQFYNVTVAALTTIGEGPSSTVVRVRTDEDKPIAPPSLVTSTATSASTINVTWSEIDPPSTLGVIKSYKIEYWRSDGQGTVQELVTSEKSAELQNLDGFVVYSMKVAGGTIKGFGVFSPILQQKTLQSKPDAPPADLKGHNISSTAIRVSWGMIPTKNRNGDITGYQIAYKKSSGDDNWRKEKVDSTTFSLEIQDLAYYTLYDIKVAGKTIIGFGPYSNITVIRTDADAPGKPPMNLTGNFLNRTSILMSWMRVPEAYRLGTILGYRLLYRDKTLAGSPWYDVIIPNRFDGNDTFSQIITGLKIYTPYLFRITAFTVKAEGTYSHDLTVWTDEHVPEETPKNLTGQEVSSTEIKLNWLSMAEIHGDANGKVLGYNVGYHAIDCHEDRPAGCDENEMFNITAFGRNSTIVIPNLRKYTEYNVSIRAFNSKGEGNYSTEVTVRTGEDKPDAAPKFLETWPSTHESIKVFWSPIPESLRNGVILGYRIFFKPIDIPLRMYGRSPRAVNPFAVYGAEPGEKMKEVNATTFKTEIDDLIDYSWYRVRIGAFTSKGLGVTFSINGTCKQKAPSIAPELIMVKDKYDFYEIYLQWLEIDKQYTNGEVLGYRINYWITELNYSPVFTTSVMQTTVFAPTTNVTLKNLKPFAIYAMNISAFTEGGFGPNSKMLSGETCRCPKVLSSSRIRLPPLVHDSQENRNILAHFANDAILTCCGNCSGGHGTTEIDWFNDGQYSSSLKYSRKSAINASLSGTHATLPIFKDVDMGLDADADPGSSPTFVPLVSVTTFNVFVRKVTLKVIGNSAAKLVLKSLWEQYPIFALSTVMTVLAGIVLWITESSVNTEEFPQSYVKGSGSGIWLAFVTMTTVGYGDINPMSRTGRIVAMVWMLIGLVLTSLIVGNLSTLLSMDFVYKPVSFQSKGKVLTSDENLMIASKLFGRNVMLGNVSDGESVQRLLLSGEVAKVLLDSFAATALQSALVHPDIHLESIHKVKASYGMYLAGEAKRASKCVSKYVSDNEESFLRQLANATFTFELGSSATSEFVKHMTSPHSDFMENFTQYGGMILAIFVVFGSIYEILRHLRVRAKVGSILSSIDTLYEDMLEKVESLANVLQEKADELETIHVNERMKLSKMQIAKFEALLKMYPDLHLFDPTIPKLKKDQTDEQELTQTFDSYDQEDFSGEIEIEMPIYYKRSQVNLQI